LEEALYLAKVAGHVYLAHRRDALRGSRILQQQVMAEAKIDILWNTIIAEILADDQGVRGVSLRDTQTGASQELAVDGVFIFIGFIPNNQLVPAGVRMDHDGYVETDEKCETNLPGIFVIGDLRRKYAKQIVMAAADGCTAALAAAHGVEMKKAAGACPTPGK
jgi:thioredoxin reductase (NADPH)